MSLLAAVRIVLRATSTLTGEPHGHGTQDSTGKLSLLDLASDLGNVSKACKVISYSRQQFYEFRRKLPTYGADGVTDGKVHTIPCPCKIVSLRGRVLCAFRRPQVDDGTMHRASFRAGCFAGSPRPDASL
jgi:hypothetical protein